MTDRFHRPITLLRRSRAILPEPRKQGWFGDLVLVIILMAGMVCVLWWLL
jgi:hypothetical protein